jgi:hypothetical protein
MGWSIAVGLILLPLVAMQMTKEVNWSPADFIVAIVLIGGVGGVFELAVRMSSDWAYRAGVGFALAGAFFLIWVNGAVGMIGDEGDAATLMFGGVLAVALAGALVARFRAEGMARAMLAAAVAHLLVTAIAVATAPRPIEPLEIILTILFCGPWLISAAFFRKAARSGTVAA